MAKKIRFKHFVFLFLISFSFTGKAQNGVVDSTNTEIPTAIPLVDINARIELTAQKVKNIEKRTQLSSSIIEIDSIIPKFEEKIELQIEAFANFKKSHPNKQKVLNLVNKWGSYNAYLNSLQQIINTHAEKNAIWIKELNYQKVRWQLSYENATIKEAPTEVVGLIEETQLTVNRLIEKVNSQNNKLLKLEIEILILKEKIDAVIDELNTWKQSEEFSILYRRHFSVWKIKDEPTQSKDVDFDAWTSFKSNLFGVYNFIFSPENSISTLVILLMLFAFWLWQIKKVVSSTSLKEADGKTIPNKKVIVEKFIITVIFTSTIVSIVYFSFTPNLLSEIFLLVASVSAVPLIRVGIHQKFKGIAVFIIILFVLNTMKSYIWYSSSFYRIYLLIESLFVMYVLFKFSRPLKITSRLELNKFSLGLVKLVPVLYLIVLAGIGANALGFTNFTDLGLKMIVQGATLVVILYGLVIVFNGYASGTLQMYYAKKKGGDYQNRFVVEKKIINVIDFLAYSFFVIYFLHVIDVYDLVTEWVLLKLNEPIDAGDISFTWFSILSFFGILTSSYLITSFIAKVVDGGVLDFLKLPKGVPAIISVIVRYFLIVFALILSLSYLGVDLGKFNLMAGALGLGIGFGLQSIISNFISGLILIFERPIQTGDVVEVGQLLGNVRKIGVRSSNIRTFSGAEVVVPNSNLISNEVINWTLSDNIKRIEINVGAAYGSSMKQVIEIIKSTAVDHKHVLKDPEPLALFDEFGDSSLNFRLLYWVPVEFGILTKSDISIEIYDRFEKDNITIPFPQRDMNFKKEDLETLKKDVNKND